VAADGNEIGGHTIDHVKLTTVSASEARRQIGDDRQALIDHGFTVTDFAYPHGTTTRASSPSSTPAGTARPVAPGDSLRSARLVRTATDGIPT
jgi:peptidoglycan/xylan/chitin deacetylase (PgdA/CDA1 family)